MCPAPALGMAYGVRGALGLPATKAYQRAFYGALSGIPGLPRGGEPSFRRYPNATRAAFVVARHAEKAMFIGVIGACWATQCCPHSRRKRRPQDQRLRLSPLGKKGSEGRRVARGLTGNQPTNRRNCQISRALMGRGQSGVTTRVTAMGRFCGSGLSG